MTGMGIQTGTERRRGRAAVVCLAGLIVLLWSGVCAADVRNGSFEETYWGLPGPRLLPSNWARATNYLGGAIHPSFSSYCTNMWSTDGTLSAALFSRLSNVSMSYRFEVGDYQGFMQYVDLTGIGSIEFDVYLTVLPSGAFEHFEASLLVDGVPLWTQTADGEYVNQKANVSHLAGYHRLEIRNTALESGTFGTAYWTLWDNVRLVEGSQTVKADITLTPSKLSLASNGRWITGYIELEEGYDVHSIDGATVTLDGIAAHLGDEGWATAEANEGNIVDHDGDGILERMVKFDRAEIVQANTMLRATADATVMVTGVVADAQFEGGATLQVTDKGGTNK